MIARENPARPSQVVGSVPVSTAAEVDAAVRAADKAFPGWAATSVEERCALLTAAADALEASVGAWAVLLAQELGKPVADCQGEIGFAIALLRRTASDAPRVCAGSEVDDGSGRLLVQRKPLGVIAAVTPWNAPVVLAMLKVAPALATGNAVVVKPSPLAPLAVSEVLSRLASVLPADLLAVVHGDAEAGAALVGHPLVRKVAFTGGGPTAQVIGAIAAQQLTPLVLELGGNDAAVVCADAALTDADVDRLLMASFATSGQVCMAVKRLYVHRSRHDELVERLVGAADRVLRTGDPLDPDVTMGPVVSRAAQHRLMALRPEGAVVLGSQGERDPDGYWVDPVLVTGLDDAHPLVAEEQFGPLLPVLAFDTEDEAVARANLGELGLCGSVWSADEERAFALARRLEVGVAFVNTHNRTGITLRAPFGGVKRSGYGREYAEEGIAEYVQTCVVHAPAAFRPGAEPVAGSASAYPSA